MKHFFIISFLFLFLSIQTEMICHFVGMQKILSFRNQKDTSNNNEAELCDDWHASIVTCASTSLRVVTPLDQSISPHWSMEVRTKFHFNKREYQVQYKSGDRSRPLSLWNIPQIPRITYLWNIPQKNLVVDFLN